jgi:hypothetical protein
MIKLADQFWRLNNIYYIIDKNGNKIKFKLNWAQMILYTTMWYCSVILKARQLGMTTFICIYFLDQALFNSNTSCGIIAHNRDDAEKFFEKKVKFAYESLPEEIKRMRPANTDSAKQLKFSNGSSLTVGTSLRSDTLQFLHVSEYGKLCAKFPEKAREIRTGAINTVQAGCYCFIESTAEGNSGDFHTITINALGKLRAGAKLSVLDFKAFFFPWHHHPEYVLEDEQAGGLDLEQMPHLLVEYFEELEDLDSIRLSTGQKLWYWKKWEVQQDEMVREYPSTPEEAFSVPLRGAFYELQIRRLIKERRLTKVPYDESLPVHTVWDLGIHDHMAIWFVQIVGKAVHFIDYYANTDKGFLFYKQRLDEKGYYYGSHIGPHDLGARQHSSTEEPETRTEIAAKVGLNFIELPQEQDVMTGINRTRTMFSRFWFDADKCSQGEQSGFGALQVYRKQWNEKLEKYDEKPLKNWAAHASDGLRYVSLAVQEDVFDNTWYDQQSLRAREQHIDRLSRVRV